MKKNQPHSKATFQYKVIPAGPIIPEAWDDLGDDGWRLIQHAHGTGFVFMREIPLPAPAIKIDVTPEPIRATEQAQATTPAVASRKIFEILKRLEVDSGLRVTRVELQKAPITGPAEDLVSVSIEFST